MLEAQNRSSHVACYHLSTTKVLKVFDIPKLFDEILQIIATFLLLSANYAQLYIVLNSAIREHR
jgi:hypothetical protein